MERYKKIENQVKDVQTQLKKSCVDVDTCNHVLALLAFGVQMTKERDEFLMELREKRKLKKDDILLKMLELSVFINREQELYQELGIGRQYNPICVSSVEKLNELAESVGKTVDKDVLESETWYSFYYNDLKFYRVEEKVE